jgi:hypothetical protein
MIFFWKPREIVIEQPAPQVEPQVPKPQSPTRPRPKPQPAQPAVIEPENQQPVFRSLQPKPAQSAVAGENQPVFRTLQPKPAQSQSAFAAYDHGLGSIQGASGKPVEVWGGGDDELTVRLRDALKDAFRSSSDFHLSSGERPGTLVITLPSNVGWKPVGGRTQVLYTAGFASEGQNLGGSKGSCWDDALAKCAAQIVKDAQIAARNGVQ